MRAMAHGRFTAVDIEAGSIPVAEQAELWDNNAPQRLAEIADDPSYQDLTTLIRSYISSERQGAQRVIDAGCGLGVLAGVLAADGHSVIGLDPASESIRLARASHSPDATFYAESLEEFAASGHAQPADVVVANMVLHAVPKLPSFMAAARKSLDTNGMLIATFPHPINYLAQRGVNVDWSVPKTLSREFGIHGREAHPSPVYFFQRSLGYISLAGASAGLIVTDYFVPRQIGQGHSRDIAFMRFEPGKVKAW